MKKEGFWFEVFRPEGSVSSSRFIMFVVSFMTLIFWPLSYLIPSLDGMSKDCIYLLGIAMVGKAAGDLVKRPTKEQ